MAWLGDFEIKERKQERVWRGVVSPFRLLLLGLVAMLKAAMVTSRRSGKRKMMMVNGFRE